MSGGYLLTPTFPTPSRCFPNGDECVELLTSLCCLISFFVVRNPKWLGDVRAGADVFAENLLSNGCLSESDLRNMALEGYGGELGAIVELAYLDTALFETGEGSPMQSLIEMMLDMDCSFFVASNGAEFVTSSLPVYAAWLDEHDRYPAGIYFPLSTNYAVVLRRELGSERLVSILQADKEQVDSFNRCLMNGNDAWDFLVSRDKAALEELVASYCVPE